MSIPRTPHASAATPAGEGTRRSRTQERLLDAAFDVFAETGVAAASVEQITEHAGFTRGAFYSNFASKEELFMALMVRRVKAWTESLTEQIEVFFAEADDSLDAESQISQVLTEILAGPYDHRAWAMIQNEFRLLALRDPELGQAYVADFLSFQDLLVPIVERALRETGLRLLLPTEDLIQLSWGLYQDRISYEFLASATDDDAIAAVRGALTKLLVLITEPA